MQLETCKSSSTVFVLVSGQLLLTVVEVDFESEAARTDKTGYRYKAKLQHSGNANAEHRESALLHPPSA